MDVQEYSVKISPLFAEPEKIQMYLLDNNFSDITKIIIVDENSFQVAFTDYNRAVALKNFIDGQIIAAKQIHADDPILLPLEETSSHPPQPPSPTLSPPPHQQYRRPDEDVRDRERDRDRDYGRAMDYPPRRDVYPSRHDLPPSSHHSYMRDDLPPPPMRRDKYYGRDELFSRTLIVKGYQAPISKRDVWNDFRSFGYLKQIEVRDNIAYLQYEKNDDAYNAMMQARKHDSPLNKLIVEPIPDRPLNIPRFVIPLVVEDDPRGLIGEREPRH